MKDQDQEIIEGIKGGNEGVVVRLYEMYRSEFFSWSGKMYGLSDDEIADVFQEAVIAFYYNVRNGKLNDLNSSVKTYLFAIGKNQVLKKFEKNSRLFVTDELPEVNDFTMGDDLFEASERQKMISKLIDELGEPCRSILKMFYFQRFTMDAIAENLGYKNEHVVKSQKLRCFNQLKEKTKKLFAVEDI